jgi:hypothetical protein
MSMATSAAAMAVSDETIEKKAFADPAGAGVPGGPLDSGS